MTPQPIETYIDPVYGVEVKRYQPGCYVDLCQRQQAGQFDHLSESEQRIVAAYQATGSLNGTRSALGVNQTAVRAAVKKAGLAPIKGGTRGPKTKEAERRLKDARDRGRITSAKKAIEKKQQRLAKLREQYNASPTHEAIEALAAQEKCNIKRLRTLLREAGCIMPERR